MTHQDATDYVRLHAQMGYAMTNQDEDEPRVVSYPMCGRWDCDDDEDWETVSDTTPGYGPEFVSAVRREQRIVDYHEPRSERWERLQAERDKRNNGKPLWFGVWA